MTSYQLPVTGYRAQCLTVHAADRLTLLVELRKGLYERIDVRLRGVQVPELRASHAPACRDKTGQDCICGAEDERQRAQAARVWVEARLRHEDTAEHEACLDHWPLRVELRREGSEWLADVWYHFAGEHDFRMGYCLNCNLGAIAIPGCCTYEVSLAHQLVVAGHAQSTEDA